MRIWFDMTASAHPVVFRPVISRLRERGHDVEITARDYAQTLGLLKLQGLEAEIFGRHAGASSLAAGAAADQTRRVASAQQQMETKPRSSPAGRIGR